MKVELWNGHAIRFVEKDSAWWAVAKDVCDALDISNNRDAMTNMPDKFIAKVRVVCDVGISDITSEKKSGVRKTHFAMD